MRAWIERIGLGVFLFIVVAFLVFAALRVASAQEVRTVDVPVTFDAPNGFSGGTFEVHLGKGSATGGVFGDMNCNGRRDFNDVVWLFQSISVLTPRVLTPCSLGGDVRVTIDSVLVPDFGLVDLGDAVATEDYRLIGIADINQRLERATVGGLLFTVRLMCAAPGVAPLVVTSLSFDDDDGNVGVRAFLARNAFC